MAWGNWCQETSVDYFFLACYPINDKRPRLFSDLRDPWILLGPAGNVGHQFFVEVVLIDQEEEVFPERLEFVLSVKLVGRYRGPVP